MAVHQYQCEHENCNSKETAEYFNQWIMPEDDLPQSEWLCDEHAIEGGYCLGCRYFCAGSERYDFSEIKGWCGDCVEELKREMGEYDEYDEYDGWDYYPESWYDANSPISKLEPPETPTHAYIGETTLSADSERQDS